MYTKALSAALLFTCLLSACLEPATRSGSDSAIGVVHYIDELDRKLIFSNVGVLFSNDIDAACQDSDCVTFTFAYDYGSPENAAFPQSGYLFVTSSQKVIIPKADVFYESTDTSTLLPHEFLLFNPIAQPNNPLSFNFVDGVLFLTSTFQGNPAHPFRWQLFCDTTQTSSVDGQQAYTFFLRASDQALIPNLTDPIPNLTDPIPNLSTPDPNSQPLSALNAYCLGQTPSHPFRIAYLASIDDQHHPSWLFSPLIY
jgi:hypothetical protein